MIEEPPIFSLDSVKTHFPVTEGFLRRESARVRAVDGVTFDLRRGEILGLVGESGSGKSTVARTLMTLETPTAGRIEFDGQPLGEMDERGRKRFKRRVQMVFQDTGSSFDPRMTVGNALQEPMEAHGLTDDERLERRVVGLLEEVGLSGEFVDRYPHQLSGGEKQRAALARALSLDPDVLLLDEPVSALDVSVQARILDLIERLRREFDLSILLITHDMAVVRQLSSRVAVMYLGEIVEVAETSTLFSDPQHPYTEALVEAIPKPDPRDGPQTLALSGSVPDPVDPPDGCRFHTRCPVVVPPSGLSLSREAWRAVYDLRVAIRDGTVSMASISERLEGGIADADLESRTAAVTPEDETTNANLADETTNADLADETTNADLADETTDTNPDRDRLAAAVRHTYNIPRELQADGAEQTVAEAIDRAIDGDLESADQILADAFASICEHEVPRPTKRGEGRVACHRRTEKAVPATDPVADYPD